MAHSSICVPQSGSQESLVYEPVVAGYQGRPIPGRQTIFTDVEDSPLEVLSLPALMAQEYLPLTWVDHPILPSGLCILAGRLKSGKSILALNLAVAVAHGGNAFQRDNLTTDHGSP